MRAYSSVERILRLPRISEPSQKLRSTLPQSSLTSDEIRPIPWKSQVITNFESLVIEGGDSSSDRYRSGLLYPQLVNPNANSTPVISARPLTRHPPAQLLQLLPSV